MALYDVVDGIYRKVAKKYDPVEGVYRKVTKAFDPVDGVYRQYFRGGVPVSTLAVGDSVWLNVDGVSTEFIVVQRGSPDGRYDGYSSYYSLSKDDTWLLAKDIYETRAFDTTNHDYANSDIHDYLENTFINLLDSNVKDSIKSIYIPYRSGANTTLKVDEGLSGLRVKVFLLSHKEVDGESGSVIPSEGSALDYFYEADDKKRKAMFNGTTTVWWLRTPYALTGKKSTGVVTNTGDTSYRTVTSSNGVRPALVLDGSTLIDPSTHTIVT